MTEQSRIRVVESAVNRDMQDFLDPFETPMTAQVVDGEVVVLGPNGVAISMTAEAARISGERLLEAARQVEGARADPDSP